MHVNTYMYVLRISRTHVTLSYFSPFDDDDYLQRSSRMFGQLPGSLKYIWIHMDGSIRMPYLTQNITINKS